jgi:thiol-disulfide isomerase/thioredoxin
VQQVYPDSPALVAGIRPGDVVLGPPGAHFAEPTQIREWTMNQTRVEKLPLEILREDTTLRMDIQLGAYPAKIPDLPAPPKEGDVAPPLDHLETVRAAPGESVLAGGRKYVLFFWATWCGPCKKSLPELMDWSEKTGVPVLAVSDEDPETIRKFLDGWTGPFPERVASDDLRAGHVAYGVSGTPTFVLVNEQGKIEWRQVGYSPTPGLAVPGWTWSGHAK